MNECRIVGTPYLRSPANNTTPGKNYGISTLFYLVVKKLMINKTQKNSGFIEICKLQDHPITVPQYFPLYGFEKN